MFTGKGVWHYVFFAAAVAVPLFMLGQGCWWPFSARRVRSVSGLADSVRSASEQISLNWTTNAFTASLMQMHASDWVHQKRTWLSTAHSDDVSSARRDSL